MYPPVDHSPSSDQFSLVFGFSRQRLAEAKNVARGEMFQIATFTWAVAKLLIFSVF